MLRKIALWIDERLYVSTLYASTAGHSVPANAESWFYVFGSGTLLCFIIQVVTGTCLAFVYTPSATEAYTSRRAVVVHAGNGIYGTGVAF